MTAASSIDIRCTFLAPGEGEQVRVFDEEMAIKVTGIDTAGIYAVATVSVAPGGGPPLHAHTGNETFYVLSGEFEFTQRDADGVSSFRGGPGTVVHAPANAPHRFENVSSTRSTMLLVVAPEATDFLRELGAAFPPGAEPDMEKMLSIHEKYRIETFHGGAGSRAEPAKDGATSARARALAWRFEQLNDALIATVEACTPAQWQAVCADTGWTVAVQAHHIATNHAPIAALVRDVADGRPHPTPSTAMLDAINARHAAEFADVTQAETVALLQDNGAAAAQLYRLLTDEQLVRTASVGEGQAPQSAAEIIEHLAIGEIERHGAEIRHAIDG